MVPYRELMALCRTVMYQSCGTCVEFRKCQCSPSVYVPCNLAVSLSWCTREQVIHQKGNIINYPSALQSTFFPPLPSDFKIKVVKSFEVVWNAQGSQNPGSRVLVHACPSRVYVFGENSALKTLDYSREQSQIPQKLHCR